ncbi:MAG: DNA polymerase IV [Bacteroidetes bacterium]|nr:DNA polymerase IV [Bacteroidota bacterium]
MRKIIHVDMDSFFASVEQRDFPEYKGKPLVVGHRGPRSVVAAASYEARKYGVYSAMPMSVALQKCPHLIVVPHRFEVYKEVSKSIQDIFHEYTDLVEPLSLDEAYLDVTEVKKGPASASIIAMAIKKEIRDRTRLVASAGVSYNKFLAKIASDMDKPDGFFLIKPEDAVSFIEDLDVGLFFGVGEKTEQKMHKMKIFKGRDLKSLTRVDLVKHYGKAGIYFYNVARGIDERPVVSFRERKSIGAERTYETDLYDIDIVIEKLAEVIDIIWERCEAKKRIGKTITLKLRFSDFSTITRSNTQSEVYTREEMVSTLMSLLPNEEIKKQGVRLLGGTMSNFQYEDRDDKKQLRIDFDR